MSIAVGIDVAKASLEVAVLDAHGQWQSGRFSNDASGFGRMQRWLVKRTSAALPASIHICLEATGRYSQALAHFLAGQGYVVSVVNPARPQHYRQALGQQTKTDKSDAKLLAHFCATQEPEAWRPPSAAQQRLQELTRHLDTLKQAHTRIHNRLEAGPQTEWVQRDLEAELAGLKQRIAALQREIAATTQADADQRQQMALLVSIPGIGRMTAARFLAEVPDVRRFDHADQLAAYAGLVPKEHASGTSVHRKPTLTQAGNSHLRHAFYMPALNAARFNPLARALADRLSAAGKAKMTIVIAVMRKLLHLAYGVLKTGLPFDPDYALKPSPA
jgi:transposase